MASQFLERKFRVLGARLQVEESPSARFEIKVERDGEGEVFKIRKSVEHDIENVVVIDLVPRLRHLLLLVEVDGQKQRFLCGHDARHWFVASVPEWVGVANVAGAVDALKTAAPAGERRKVVDQPRLAKVRAYVRQGPSFFIPAPMLTVNPAWVHVNEPVRGSVAVKPHIAQYCVRLKGEAMWVCELYPEGLRGGEHERVLESRPEARDWQWEVRHRNPRVYVKGRVRHADHKVIVLPGWHRVVLSAEDESTARRFDRSAS